MKGQPGGLTKRVALGVLAVSMAFAACGSDDDENESTSTTAGSDETTTTASDATTTTGEESTGPSEGAGTPEPQPLAERETIRVGVSGPLEYFFPFHVAEVDGEFDAENLDVEFVTVEITNIIPALATGQIDVAVNSANAAALNAVNQGVPMKFLWTPNSDFGPESQQGLWVRKDRLTDDGAIDPEQVSDMTFAIGQSQLSGSFAYTLQEALDGTGVGVTDVTLVSISNQDSFLGLQNGTVDAATVLTPFSLDPGLEDCCARVDADLLSNGAVLALADTIEDKRDALEALARAVLRTQRTRFQVDFHADEDLSQILADWTQQPVETIRQYPPGYIFGTELEFKTDVLEQLQDLWISVGGILDVTEPMPDDELVDTSIIDAVNAE